MNKSIFYVVTFLAVVGIAVVAVYAIVQNNRAELVVNERVEDIVLHGDGGIGDTLRERYPELARESKLKVQGPQDGELVRIGSSELIKWSTDVEPISQFVRLRRFDAATLSELLPSYPLTENLQNNSFRWEVPQQLEWYMDRNEPILLTRQGVVYVLQIETIAQVYGRGTPERITGSSGVFYIE